MKLSKIIWLSNIALLPFLFTRSGESYLDALLLRTAFWSIVNLVVFALTWKELSKSIFKQKGALSFMVYGSVALLTYLLFCLIKSPNQYEGISEVIKIVNCFFTLVLSVHFIRDEENTLLVLSKVIGAQTVLITLIGVFQYFGFISNCGAGLAPCGFLANRNLFGSEIVLGLPFLLFQLHQNIIQKNKSLWLYAAATIIVFVGIYLSQTRSAWLAGGLVLVFYVLYFLAKLRFRYVFLAFFLVSSAGGFWFYQNSNLKFYASDEKEETWRDLTQTDSRAERLLLWEKTLEMAKKNPLLGVGFQNWKYQLPKYSLEGLRSDNNEVNAQRPHNDYLWIAAENGFLSLALYLLFLAYFVFIGIKNRSIFVMVVLAFAVDSLFSFPKERIVHSLLLMLSLAIIIAQQMPKKEASKTKEKPSKKKQKAIPKPENKPSLSPISAYLGITVLLCCAYLSFRQHSDKKKTIALLEFNQSRNFNGVLSLADEINKELVPSDFFINSVYMHEGYALSGLGKTAQAKASFETGLEQMPYNIALLQQLANISEKEKNYEQAITYYERIQKVIPHLPLTYQKMYNNYILKGDTTKAVEIIKRCPEPCK